MPSVERIELSSVDHAQLLVMRAKQRELEQQLVQAKEQLAWACGVVVQRMNYQLQATGHPSLNDCEIELDLDAGRLQVTRP